MVFIVLGGIVLLKCLMGETEVLLTFFSLSRVNMQQAEKKVKLQQTDQRGVQ